MRLIHLCPAIAFFSLFLGIVRGQDSPTTGLSFTCGLNSAYIFLNKTGHHARYAELLGDFESQNPPDSLLAIQNVLEQHGCTTIGIKTGADFFLNKSGPAIVYLQLSGFGPMKENHFSYFVQGNRQTGAEFLDPVFDVNTAAFMSWDTFSRIYQGVALILK